jgi:pimeloyl-ACP methyl ester carboxylesterase
VATDRRITVNGLGIHYLDWGNAAVPPLVFVHGFTSQAHAWDAVAAALSDRFHVIAVDKRGHGDSDWSPDGEYPAERYLADLEGFLDALGLETFSLVGYSLGGRTVMTYGGSHPRRLRRLVIGDVGPRAETAGVNRIIERQLAMPDRFETLDAVADHVAPTAPTATRETLLHVARTGSVQLRSGRYALKYDPRMRMDWPRRAAPAVDLWPYLERISCPTLVLRAGDSDILGAEQAAEMVRRLPDGRLAEVPGVGHGMVYERPAAVAAILGEFLTE